MNIQKNNFKQEILFKKYYLLNYLLKFIKVKGKFVDKKKTAFLFYQNWKYFEIKNFRFLTSFVIMLFSWV